MDKKSQFLIIMFALLITASIVATYYKYIILENITFHTDQEAFNEAIGEEGAGGITEGFDITSKNYESATDTIYTVATSSPE